MCKSKNIMQNREHLFRLTDPHPSHRFSYTLSSPPHNSLPLSSPPHNSPPPLTQHPLDTLRKSSLKFKYLHRLDEQNIDRKYELMQRLKRITRVEGQAQLGREKQYSIKSFYLFNENEPMERRYEVLSNKLQRNRSHNHIHSQALPNEEILQHQMKDHRQFLQKFKPKPTGPLLAKRFRFNRKSHGKLRPFE